MNGKLSAFLLTSGVALAASHATAQTILFADNFNRANNNSLNASATGMSGTLSPLTWQEVWQNGNPGNDATLQINNNTLTKSNTGGSGAGGLDHNFTDASILAAGGFKVSLDVTSLSANAADMPDRYGGFGVGLTLAEVSGFNDENTSNNGPRGAIAQDTVASNVGTYGVDAFMHTGVADFFVDLSLENKVQVFAGGMLVNQFPVTPTGARTVEAEFSFSDFNMGSLVNYIVRFEGAQVTTGAFTWSNTDENYVGYSLRDATVVADNLSISTVPEPSTSLLGAAGMALAAWTLRRKRQSFSGKSVAGQQI